MVFKDCWWQLPAILVVTCSLVWLPSGNLLEVSQRVLGIPMAVPALLSLGFLGYGVVADKSKGESKPNVTAVTVVLGMWTGLLLLQSLQL